MSSRQTLLIIVLLSAVCGALLQRHFDSLQSVVTPVSNEQLDDERAMLRSEFARLDSSRRMVATRAQRNDSLVQIRSHQRALIARPIPDITRPVRSPIDPATIQLHHAIRTDDRLLAELLRERSRTQSLQRDYQSLVARSNREVDLLSEQLLQQRAIEKRARRRTIFTVAAVTAAVTLLLSRS